MTATRTVRGFTWETFGVSAAAKTPLYARVLQGFRDGGCAILSHTPFNEAPLYVVLDAPNGERHGLLVYAFLSNARVTANRPEDEHRFQIKYGGNLKRSFDIAIDPSELITTLFMGIDPERELFVAVDPAMNTPAPMSRSIEYKRQDIERARDTGWHSWARERRAPKTTDRPGAELEDRRVETVTGGHCTRLLDLVRLERLARGMDPGTRHLIADKLDTLLDALPPQRHALLDELEIDERALLDLIAGAARLKMAVRGWVAEEHLHRRLLALTGVSNCERLEQDGMADISLRWRGDGPILIECKNALRARYADGRIKVDFQRTRASQGDRCSRYYSPEDFPVLAVCTHSVTEQWAFELALTADLERHGSCPGKLASAVGIAPPTFSPDIARVLDRVRELSRG